MYACLQIAPIYAYIAECHVAACRAADNSVNILKLNAVPTGLEIKTEERRVAKMSASVFTLVILVMLH